MSVADEQGEVLNEKHQIIDTGIEALHCGALQRRAPFYAKVLGKKDNGQGYWNYLNVGIFQRPDADLSVKGYSEPLVSDTDIQIGEFQRNYSTMYRTFHPFQMTGKTRSTPKWYALYSKDYTSTRIMSLPDCQDIGGEDRDCWGFCPTDFYVPGLHYIESLHDEGCPRDDKRGHTPDGTKACTCTIVHEHGCPCCPETRVKNGSCTCKEAWSKHFDKYHIWHFPDRVHGFVSGCVWGDDSSWKIEYLDLSRADEGIIKREARFGYIEMPAHLTLDKAINLEAYEHDHMWLRIATETNYDLATGKRSDEE